jgi:predicted  nucleic acid-binding Zn-ribbon protein
MNQAFHLYRLQQIDTQIDQAETQMAEVNRRLAGDEKIQQAQKAADDAAAQVQKAQKALKQTELAVKEQQIKIAQAESTLYSGLVKIPKELQDLQKDITSLKKHLGSLEDRQLEAMISLEEAEGQEKSCQQALIQEKIAFTEKSAGWLGKKDLLLHALERLHAERAAAVAPIVPDTLKDYESMRKRKNGVAVTTVKDGNCSVCGATIRPSEVQAARNALDPVYCSSCGRILYAV